MNTRDEAVILVTYGAGAIGWALGADITAGHHRPNSRYLTPGPMFGVTRSKDFESVNLRSSLIPLEITLGPIQTFRILDLESIIRTYTNGQTLCVVIAVPPEALDDAVSNCMDLIESLPQTLSGDSTVFIASNGTLSSMQWSRCKRMTEKYRGLRIIRTIVIAGFWARLDSDSKKLMIEHTAGQTIYWGDVGTSGETIPPKHFFSQLIFQAFHSDDIRKYEFQKCFVNTVIGWWIGPNLHPNETLKSLLSIKNSRRLAETFTRIFPETGNAQDLVALLWQTISTTGPNINSVSRAWTDGNPSLANYFRNFLEKGIERLQNPQDLGLGLQLWRAKFNDVP